MAHTVGTPDQADVNQPLGHLLCVRARAAEVSIHTEEMDAVGALAHHGSPGTDLRGFPPYTGAGQRGDTSTEPGLPGMASPPCNTKVRFPPEASEHRNRTYVRRAYGHQEQGEPSSQPVTHCAEP